MKKVFKEFKEFITRGNVIDLAVGVIIGGAFTAIVTALTNCILYPLVNWLLSLAGGKDGLSSAVTILVPGYVEDAATGTKIFDLASSIYIDWGAFISAIINFLLVALILFFIVKAINTISKRTKEIEGKMLSQTREKKLAKLEKKNAKRVAKGLEPLPIPAELLPPEPAPEPVVEPDPQLELLAEIRDLLKSKK